MIFWAPGIMMLRVKNEVFGGEIMDMELCQE